MKKTIGIMALLLSTSAFAGGSVGNGGDGVVCRNPDGSVKSIELLDYYEARVQKGFELLLGDPNENYKPKVDRLLERLSHRALIRSKKYAELAADFMNQVAMIPGVDLVDIPDSQNIIVAKNCKVEQVAIQREPQLPGDKRYTVSKDLWDLMDGNQKAGLILHEVIYRDALEWEHENSVEVRYLNALIVSTQFDQMDQNAFNQLLATLKFPGIDMMGTIGEIEVKNDKIIYGSLDSEFFNSVLPESFKYKGLYLSGKVFALFLNPADQTLNEAWGVVGIHRPNLEIEVPYDKWMMIKFWPQEKIKEIDSIGSGTIIVHRGESQITLFPGTRFFLDENENPAGYYGEIQSKIPQLKYDSGTFEGDFSFDYNYKGKNLYPTGIVRIGRFGGKRTFSTPQGPLEFTCTSQGHVIDDVVFSENGQVKEGYVTPGQKVMTPKGEVVTTHQRVLFNDDGSSNL